ncbi:MAG: hypothetical protein AB9882_12860 [Ignavibacteriaceae bacterium]
MIGVIDFGINKNSDLIKALKELGVEYTITNEESQIIKCSKIILPDTDDINTAVKKLHLSNLFTYLRVYKKPALGIASGLKIMCEYAGEENKACLGIFPLTTSKLVNLQFSPGTLYSLKFRDTSIPRLLKDIPLDTKFYFNRLFDFPCNLYATSCIKEIESICAIVEKDNFTAVHFSPEKSGKYGLQMLNNFINNP